MHKIIHLLILTGFILAACSPASTSTPSPSLPTSTQERTATPAFMPCMNLHTLVTPQAALGAEFENHSHISGPVDAPVTIIVFSDYQCLSCAFLAASLKQIRLLHPQDVRIIYINAPQPEQDKDALAIRSVEAADLQGKFWEMNDLLFEKLGEWSGLVPAEFQSWVAAQAVDLGMDPSRFQSDFTSQVVSDRLEQAVQSFATQPFVPPKLFVNSTTPYTGLADFASLDAVVQLDALATRQFSECPPWLVDPLKQYIVTLHTIRDDAVLQLFPEKAPLAVNNFIFLARTGWYNGITFYRVLPQNLVMTGDPSDTGLGNPGYLFSTEMIPGLLFDQPGLVAMDNNGPETNGSRFFITLAAAPQMNGQYTIFGQVLSGLEVLASLSSRDPHPGIYLQPGDELISVSVDER
jgi:cyclophilin family peptidyl-prolyl cis-trans isomerase